MSDDDYGCDICGKDGLAEDEMHDLGGDRIYNDMLTAYPAVCVRCHEAGP